MTISWVGLNRGRRRAAEEAWDSWDSCSWRGDRCCCDSSFLFSLSPSESSSSESESELMEEDEEEELDEEEVEEELDESESASTASSFSFPAADTSSSLGVSSSRGCSCSGLTSAFWGDCVMIVAETRGSVSGVSRVEATSVGGGCALSGEVAEASGFVSGLSCVGISLLPLLDVLDSVVELLSLLDDDDCDAEELGAISSSGSFL